MSNPNSVAITIVCALHCEAKTFIDFYKLKKQSQIHLFDVYQCDNISLIVSGIGQHNMIAAVNWFAGHFNIANRPALWLNIGIAGHKSADIGELFCCHKISEASQKNPFYPTKWLKHNIPLMPLISHHQVETDYPDNALVDMEGYAFYQSALRFNSQEQVQCLKIVSDNEANPPHKDKTIIANLIAPHAANINQYIQNHQQALLPLVVENELASFESTLLSSIHFSVSQKIQLKSKLLSIQSQQISFDENDFTHIDNANKLLAALSQLIEHNAVNI